MAEELNINSKIIVNPTVREKDGLAMSSRNVYLNKEQRKDAAVLYKSLKFARDNLKTKKITNLRTIKKKMYSVIKSRQSVTKIDYISFNNNSNLEVIKSVKDMKKGSELLISLAVRFGRIRLIDNIVIKY
jgi:pantoate--beta-alanine ligase